jgi:protein-tyrosine phosphatase
MILPPAGLQQHTALPQTINYEQLSNYLCKMKILMVCLGNICRSPMAEGILQDMARRSGLNWTIESAGTNGYHTGEPPHPLSIKVAKANGIDISEQKSRKFVKSDVEQFDMIYAMASDVLDEINRISGDTFNASKVDLLMNQLYSGKNRDVPDPWYGTEPGYHEVYALIYKACEQIILKHLNPEQKIYA